MQSTARQPLLEFLISQPAQRKVFVVERALTTSDVVQLLLSTLASPVPPGNLQNMLGMMSRPVVLVTNNSLLGGLGYPMIGDAQLPQILSYLPPQVFLLFATDAVDYGLLQSRRDNVIIVLGFGFRMGLANGLRNFLQPLRTVEVLYPSLQHIEFAIQEVQMSAEQIQEYRHRNQLITAQSFAGAPEPAQGYTAQGFTNLPIAGPELANLPSAVPGEGLISPKVRGGTGSPQGRNALRETIKALERANLVYPPDMQRQFNELAEPQRNVPADILVGQYDSGRPGWINDQVLNALSLFSPKFAAVLNRLQRGRKYMIVTTFKNHHGLNFLRSLLQIQGWPYIEISSETKSLWPQLIGAYNNATEGILLMTNQTHLQYQPQGVDELIFLEGTKFATIESIIRLVFNYSNYPSGANHTLRTVFMISRSSERYGTIDSDYYKRFRDIEEDQERAYAALTENALGLYRDLSVGFRAV